MMIDQLPKGGKIYIAGPITGFMDMNKPKFKKVADNLINMGFVPINPHDLDKPGDEAMTHPQYMRRDIKVMCDCDGAVFMPGWEYSAGARLEWDVAAGIGLPTAVLTYADLGVSLE